MGGSQQRIRIKSEEHVLTPDDIINAARAEAPRRINSYFVEIEGRRFPPKQLLRAATKTNQPFDTGVAVRALQALGFKVVSLAEPSQPAK
jgi:5-methylcytosine-specific restriction enzyme B